MTSPKLEVRVDPAKRAVWKAFADADGLTLSAFVKKACDTAVRDAPYLTAQDIEAFYQVAEQLRRAGVNLNTLVRDLHALAVGRHKNEPHAEEFRELRQELGQALQSVNDLLNRRA